MVQEMLSELMKVWPEVTRVVLGKHKVFHYSSETPAHKFQTLIKPMDGPRLIELTARDSFDDRLARFLLDNVKVQDLPATSSGRIRVVAAKFPKPWPFECFVVVPPKIAKRFEHESARLKRITYWIVPAFAFEFRDGEDGNGFWLQIRRRDGWNVSVIRWDRFRKTKPVYDL